MKLIQLIREAPVGDYVALNNADRNNTFNKYGRAEAKWFHNPKYEAEVRKYFNYFDQIIDIYFTNTLNLEYGRITTLYDLKSIDSSFTELIKSRNSSSSDQISPIEADINQSLSQGHIVVITTGNMSAKKGKGIESLTPWLLVHRFWQACFDTVKSKPEMRKHPAVKILGRLGSRVSRLCNDDTEINNNTWHSVLGMGSARNKTISQNHDDIIYEIMTEYTKLGKVRLYDEKHFMSTYVSISNETDDQKRQRYRECIEIVNDSVLSSYDIMKRLEGFIVLTG